MRKILTTIFGMSLILLLVACGANKVDDATAEKYIGEAEAVIHLLNEGNYEEVHEKFNDSMKEGLPVEAMQELTPIIEESGNFEKIDKASVEEKDAHYISVLVAKYSNKKRVYTITFNENNEIAGLYIK